MTPEERVHQRATRPSFWAVPTAATHDRAAAMLPALQRERLDIYGIDYAFLYLPRVWEWRFLPKPKCDWRRFVPTT